ncbi:MAG: ATP-binding protein, partial [Dehalococcoidia bacterium]|nr:ATP-binding protein [Dehalococcoidia bacterium]
LHKVDRLRERAETIMEGVRRFSHELRPAILDQLGLLPALEWLADDINVSYGIDASITIKGTQRRFSPEMELELFRIAQEAFSNVRKHAQASKMNVIVEFGEGKTTVTIYDNGKGFDTGDNLANLPRTGKLGLAGMEERVRLISGTLRIQSELGKGTTIAVVIPQ